MSKFERFIKKSWILSILLILVLTGCSDKTKKENVFVTSQYEETNTLITESPTEAIIDENLVDVVRVVDGDTIVVDLDGKEEKVRFLLIDTPESVHANASKNTEFGKTASNFTKELLEGKKVNLEFDIAERDRYGRLLAYVYIGNEMVNETLLKEGMAKVAIFQPNVKYVDQFRELEKEAQENKVGIWADGVSAFENPTEPQNNQNNFAQADKNEEANQDVVQEGNYIANSNTMKFHEASCRHVKRMSEGNKIKYNTREDAVNAGYQPCKVCNP